MLAVHRVNSQTAAPLTLPKMKLLQLLLPLWIQQGELMLQEFVRTQTISISQSVNINTKTEFTLEAYSRHIFFQKLLLDQGACPGEGQASCSYVRCWPRNAFWKSERFLISTFYYVIPSNSHLSYSFWYLFLTFFLSLSYVNFSWNFRN